MTGRFVGADDWTGSNDPETDIFWSRYLEYQALDGFMICAIVIVSSGRMKYIPYMTYIDVTEWEVVAPTR